MSDPTFLDAPECRAALALLGAVEDAALVLDPAGRVAWCNAAAERIATALDLDPVHLLGRPVAELARSVAAPGLDDAVKAALTRGAAPDRAGGTPAPGGATVDLALPPTGRRVRVRVVPIAGGAALIARDPADSATLEAARDEHEHRYRTLVDSVPVPFVIVDPVTQRIVARNRAVERAFPALGGLVGQPATRLFAREDLAVLLEAPRRADDAHARAGVFAVQRGDGTLAEADVEALAIDFGGREAVLVGVRDLSATRLVEAERALLRAAVAQLNDLIVISRARPDPDGSLPIVFVNEAFERHTGWTREEAIGRPSTLLDGPGTDPALIARVREHMQRGESVRVELLHYTRDGHEYWAEMALAPIVSATGELTHWVAVHRDISERKRLEEQLFQVQKLEAVGRLAGGVAHDFNNALTAISGFSELLLEELPAGEGPHEEVLQIRAATARAAALTRQLLAFSRRQILRPRRIDLGALVQGMRGLVDRAVTEEVGIHTRIAEPVPSVLADETQLEQVLLNLVVNANEAMPAGGTLSIEVSDVVLDEAYARRHHGVQPGHYVCLSVSDTGLGMDRATRERIWEPFFSTKAGATGLGLSSVYGIVRQSGGHVWAYSEPGTGSTFRVYLPVAAGDAPSSSVVAGSTDALGGTETIIVVEDETLVREVTRAMLERRGYRVLAARDVEEAMRLVTHHLGPIDLLLSDVVMPKANGRQVAERLRLVRPGLPVVFMSGYTEDAIVQHGVLEPGVVLLEKPFTEQQLARTVRHVIDSATVGAR